MALISTTEAARRINANPRTVLRRCKLPPGHPDHIPAARLNGTGNFVIDDSTLDSIKINPRGWRKGRARKATCRN